MFGRKRGHGGACLRRSSTSGNTSACTRPVDGISAAQITPAEIPSIRPAFNLPTIPFRSRLVSMTQALRPACVIHRCSSSRHTSRASTTTVVCRCRQPLSRSDETSPKIRRLILRPPLPPPTAETRKVRSRRDIFSSAPRELETFEASTPRQK